MELISVIIPVYNAEQYLKKCLLSVCEQTYKDLEILLIDDGSTDASSSICDRFALEDCRIHVIHQGNGGVSHARNVGISSSNGKYIMFVDSNDFIERDMIEKLYLAIKQNDADLSICNFDYPDRNETNPEVYPVCDELISGMEVLKNRVFQPKSNYWIVAWNKLYKKEVFSQIRFPEGKICGDAYIMHEIYLNCRKIACIHDVLYHYVPRADSITLSSPGIRKTMDDMEALAVRLQAYLEYPELRLQALKIMKTISRDYDSIPSSGICDNKQQIRSVKQKYRRACLNLLRYGKSFSLEDKGFLCVTFLNINGWNYIAKVKALKHTTKNIIASWTGKEEMLLNIPKEDWDRFQTYKLTGSYNDEIMVIPHTGNYEAGWAFILDENGNEKKRMSFPSYPYLLRKLRLPNGKIRYAYLQTEQPIRGSGFSLEHTHAVLLDDQFQVLRDPIKLLKGGSIKTKTFPCENHEYVILDDDHYVLTTEKSCYVRNIPSLKNKLARVFNSIVQEQKNGKVVWQFEAIHYPELYEASVFHNNYEDYSGKQLLYCIAADYAHINAVTIDPVTKDFLFSFRNIGLVKVSRKTKEILWIMGRGRNDIQGMEMDQIGLFQHDVRYQKDGSFTIFDNYGCPEDFSRVCRYWVNEKTKTLERYEEYRTERPRSSCMGSAQLLDDEKNIYLVCYGGLNFDMNKRQLTSEPAFEIYNFNEKKSVMHLTFDLKFGCYQVQCGIKDVPEV